MSNTTDKMLDRYVYLHIEPTDDMPNGITIHVKLDDEGVVVDAWDEPADAVDGAIATTCKTYNDMGVGVVAVETLEELRDKARKWDEYIKSVIKNTGGCK